MTYHIPYLFPDEISVPAAAPAASFKSPCVYWSFRGARDCGRTAYPEAGSEEFVPFELCGALSVRPPTLPVRKAAPTDRGATLACALARQSEFAAAVSRWGPASVDGPALRPEVQSPRI